MKGNCLILIFHNSADNNFSRTQLLFIHFGIIVVNMHNQRNYIEVFYNWIYFVTMESLE